MIDLNTKCIVTKSHFGYNEYYNICTHQVQDVVPWTAPDYMGFSFMAFVVFVTVAFVVFASYIVYDMLK